MLLTGSEALTLRLTRSMPLRFCRVAKVEAHAVYRRPSGPEQRLPVRGFDSSSFNSALERGRGEGGGCARAFRRRMPISTRDLLACRRGLAAPLRHAAVKAA